MKFKNNYTEDFAKMKLGTQVLKITEAEYDDEYGSVSLKLTNKAGANLYKTFYIMRDGEVNESVKRAMDFIAWKALGNKDAYEETDLIGCFIETDVIVDDYQSEKKGKKILTIDLWNTEHADGFPKEKKAASSKKAKDIDLDDELGEDDDE
jgi:hypothetical protein